MSHRRSDLAILSTAVLALSLPVELSAQRWTQPVAERTAPAASEMPGPLREVGFDQRLGETLPGDLRLIDETGAAVRLSDFFGQRPIVLLPMYYECPMLCTMVLNGLVGALRALDFAPGVEYEVVAFSFDPRETPEQATARQGQALERYGHPETAGAWHFLTADAETIARLTEAIGFRYTWDEETGQFAHAAGIVLLTPDGMVSRYLFGVEPAPRDLRLGMVEAADGRIGTLVDQALLFCYRYDPTIGKYSAATMNLIRLGGIVTLAALALYFLVTRRRDKDRRRPSLREA